MSLRTVLVAALTVTGAYGSPEFVADPEPRSCPLQKDILGDAVQLAVGHGELWLRGRRGQLIAVRPGAKQTVLAPFKASALLRSSHGEIWAAAERGTDAVIWRREKGGWKERFAKPRRGAAICGIVEGEGPGLVTSRLLAMPSVTVAFSETLPLGRVSSSFALTGRALWVGSNAGEWAGGLVRISLPGGQVLRLRGPSLDPGLDPTTAIIRDGSSCVVAAIGLIHFFEHGRVIRGCEDGRIELVADWQTPSDPTAKPTDPPYRHRPIHHAVLSLLHTEHGLFAATLHGLRRVDRPEDAPIAWGDFEQICGLRVARPTAGVLAVLTEANRAASVSGYTPLLVEDDPSLWVNDSR